MAAHSGREVSSCCSPVEKISKWYEVNKEVPEWTLLDSYTFDVTENRITLTVLVKNKLGELIALNRFPGIKSEKNEKQIRFQFEIKSTIEQEIEEIVLIIHKAFPEICKNLKK